MLGLVLDTDWLNSTTLPKLNCVTDSNAHVPPVGA